MTLLSLDTNGVSTVDEIHTNNSSSSPMNNNKRSLESSSPEQVLIKRRFQKSIPSNFSFKIIKTFFFFFLAVITQQNYCISYPNNIPRCVDCQTANPSDFSLHLAGCRFQHCRT